MWSMRWMFWITKNLTVLFRYRVSDSIEVATCRARTPMTHATVPTKLDGESPLLSPPGASLCQAIWSTVVGWRLAGPVSDWSEVLV